MLLTMSIMKNEADRYLEKVIKHTQQFADKMIILDDHSTDASVELARDLGCEVYDADDGISFNIHEGQLRALAWDCLAEFARPGDWVLCVDMDEILWQYNSLDHLLDQKLYEVIGIRFYHIWQPPHFARVDKAWAPNISSRLFRYYPGAEFKNRKLASGAEPLYVLELMRQNRMMMYTPLLFEHLGYMRNDDKISKYKRYSELDGGAFHSGAHIQSILDPNPTLVDISSMCIP